MYRPMQFLKEEFTKFNWSLYECQPTRISFQRASDELFMVSQDKSSGFEKIGVSFPLPNSPYNVYTTFDSFHEAHDYIVSKLDYLNKN